MTRACWARTVSCAGCGRPCSITSRRAVLSRQLGVALVKGTTDYMLNIPAPNPADFNADGKVNDADLNVWQTNFGLHELALHAQGDADLDGDVDNGDFLAWQMNYGTGVPATAAVPEPAGAVLLFVAASVVGASRRRQRLSA